MRSILKISQNELSGAYIACLREALQMLMQEVKVTTYEVRYYLYLAIGHILQCDQAHPRLDKVG